jgi:FkbM family methyltransferase
MKKLLKSLYAAMPFKQPLFKILRAFPVPQRVYQHLHFQGIIDVPVPGRGSFRMRHHGYMIENELFWRGIKGWEKISLELWMRLCRRSDTIIDVGANTGVYALLAKAVKPDATIIAVEPVARVFRKLEENIALNGGGIHAVRAAMTDHEGEVMLYDLPESDHVLAVSLNKEHLAYLPAARPVPVPARTMAGIAQEFRLPRIDLMKIDVETHEPEVLAGFIDILRRDKPTLLIEILNDKVAARVEEQVRGLGYLFYNIDDVTWPPEKAATLTKSKHFNYLFCQLEVAHAIGLE